jgi:hypothetical protein
MVKHYSVFTIFYLCNEFVEFYYLPAAKLYLLITRVCTFEVVKLHKLHKLITKVWAHRVPAISCNLPLEFLHVSVCRVVNHIGR